MSFNRSLNTERGEWTLMFPASLPAGANDWKRDLAREADAIVIDRADLPEVSEGVDGPRVPDAGGLGTFRLRDWNQPRERAMVLLALAEHLDAHPPVDEAQVEALASDILRIDVPVNNGSEWPHSWARRLVAAGWSK